MNKDEKKNVSKLELSPIKQKLDKLKNITADNIDKILVRGEKIDNLVDTTNNLNTQSMEFKKKTNKLKNDMLKRKYICYFVYLCFFIFLIYFMCVWICGSFNLKKC